MTNSDLLRQIEAAVLACISTDSIRRQQAYTFVEQIKTNPTESISIGFDLLEEKCQCDPIVKHFGLQCIEETIKYKWTSLDSQTKLSVKERLWTLMIRFEHPPNHLKTILVRCVCEIAKREWPQQWASLLDELVTLSKLNTNDYSLLILAYLIEDVIVLQTLNPTRKRDIQTTLLQHAKKLVEFTDCFLDLSNSSTTTTSALYTSTMLATFIPIEIYFTSPIISKIVSLLNSTVHRMKVAEFLSVLADRRGKFEERLPLLQLFSHLFQNRSHYNDLFSNSEQIKQPNDVYDFMKQYAMVLTALCEQVCYLCGGEDLAKKVSLPEEFQNGTFAQVLLALMQHPSIYISLYGYQMWLQLIKANVLQEKDYQTILPVVLRAICHSLVKQPYKKNEEDLASYYTHYDFEDEADYQKFIGKNRTVLIRSVTCVCTTPEHLAMTIRIGFDYADFCLQPINRGNMLLFESLVAYWQIVEKHLRSLLTIGESFNSSKLLSESDEKSFCQRGQAFIEQLLLTNNDSSLEFIAYSLRFLTCLYVFTRGDHTWTQRILEYLFRAITHERPGMPVSNPLQRQASCLIDLCLNYGHSIFVYFNDLFKVTQDLVRQQQTSQQMRLAGWQWSVLVECLAILLNRFETFQQQALLIHELVQPFAEILAKFNLAVNDPQSFIDYIGLKAMPDVTSTSNQRLLFLSVHILCGLLRRITLPTDPTICSTGGYQEIVDGTTFIRNPASPIFIQLTPSLFKLLTYCHALHAPTSPLVQSPFAFLSTMTDAEKAIYLQQQDNNDEMNNAGIPPSSTTKTHTLILSANDRRLHNRFSSFLDRLQILVGTCFSLKPDLYTSKDALNTIGTTLFASLDYLPEFRLRNIVRNLFLPFIRQCPNVSMLMAILESLLPFVYIKLKEKWKIISERQATQLSNGNNHSDEDAHQTQDRCEEEVIEEQVTCNLTRDFVDAIKSFLTRPTDNNNPSNGYTNEIDEMISDEMMTSDEQYSNDAPSRKGSRSQLLSEIGLKLLQDSPTICQYSLLILFDGLSWPDTSTTSKMSTIAHGLVKHLSTLISGNENFLKQLYIHVLCALKTHGDNEPIICTLLSLAVSMYEIFQQSSSNLFDSVLMEIPDVTSEQVTIYRDKMQRQTVARPLSDKQKRDILKHLVQPLMGKNVAQMFKREPLALNDLPPLVRFSKRSLHPVLQQHLRTDINDDHGLANLFQHTDD